MAPQPDPAELRATLEALRPWLLDSDLPAPERSQLAAAVRASAHTLAALVPGHTVEVRVPPFVAVQCVAGPRHTRGNPPNVVETDPRTWLLLVTGLLPGLEGRRTGKIDASGPRAHEIDKWLPLVRFGPDESPPTSD